MNKALIFNYLFFLLIFVVSVVAIKEDIKNKKIKNIRILDGLIAGVVLFVLGYLLGVFSLQYFGMIFFNVAVSMVVVYAFWSLNFWPAGDAKLFVLFSFLLPLNSYIKNYFPIFPSFALLVNIFVVAFIFLVFCAVFYFLRELFGGNIKIWQQLNGDNMKELFVSARKKMKKELVLRIAKSFLMISFFMIPSIYYGGFGNMDILDMVRRSFLSLIIGAVIFYIVNKYIEDTQDYEILVQDLKEGMCLSIKTINNFFSRELIDALGSLRADGLNQEQVALVCNFMFIQGNKKMLVQKHVPFAPWIILGVIVTILLKGSVMQLIMNSL